MSFLGVLGKIGGAIGSAALGVGGAAASSAFNYKQQSKLQQQQFGYQQQLNAQQQQYARENADVQYQRQRDLTADSWLLNKQGMRSAGINPAFVDGSSNATASVDAAAAPSAGSAAMGSVSPVDFTSSAVQGIQTLLTGAQINNLNANTKKTLTDADRAKFDFDNYKQNQVKWINSELLNKALQSRYEAEAQYEESGKRQTEAQYWNSKAGQLIKQKIDAEVQSAVTAMQQANFDYEKAKEFKPKEFDKLDAEITKLIEDGQLIHEKSVNQRIVNRFNDMGIGISSDMIGSIAALLTSGHGDKLASSAVDTLKSFFSGLISSVKNSIFN